MGFIYDTLHVGDHGFDLKLSYTQKHWTPKFGKVAKPDKFDLYLIEIRELRSEEPRKKWDFSWNLEIKLGGAQRELGGSQRELGGPQGEL